MKKPFDPAGREKLDLETKDKKEAERMNLKSENLQKEYEKADFSTRVNLFLEFPDLRPWFMEIEQAESQQTSSAVTPGKRKGYPGIFTFLFKKVNPV